jgi:hypothetical protein
MFPTNDKSDATPPTQFWWRSGDSYKKFVWKGNYRERGFLSTGHRVDSTVWSLKKGREETRFAVY